MKHYRILPTLIAVLAFAGVDAQTATDVPRLVVSITIDQLRTDYMEAFTSLYGERGFKRLMRGGYTVLQAEYPFVSPDRASAVACIYTGTTPYNNGIVGESWLNRATLQPLYCVEDKTYPGNLTTESSSPDRMAVSTIGDELKIATDGKSIVYAVSPQRDAAILSAGHAADGAFWINDLTGQWCTTSYYGAYPSWALNYHRFQPLGQRISDIEWEPANALVGNFNYFVSGGVKTPFKHRFQGENKYRSFKASACVNEEVTRFATHCAEQTLMGMDGVTDLLAVTYYAGNFEHQPVSEYPIELQDTYVRLDRELGKLMDTVEKRVGTGRVLFVVTSTGYADEENGDLSKFRIPTGTFSITKASALLNMYLMAIYGEGRYVEAEFGSQLFLNHKLIEDKQLNLTEIFERSQDFLSQMAGVKDVFTSQRLALGSGTPFINRLRNGFNTQRSGDIYIEVAPGWNLVNEQTYEQKLVRESYIGFPLFIMGCNVLAQLVKTPVSVDCIAPTLAQFMRIRAPNACATAPLAGLR